MFVLLFIHILMLSFAFFLSFCNVRNMVKFINHFGPTAIASSRVELDKIACTCMHIILIYCSMVNRILGIMSLS